MSFKYTIENQQIVLNLQQNNEQKNVGTTQQQLRQQNSQNQGQLKDNDKVHSDTDSMRVQYDDIEEVKQSSSSSNGPGSSQDEEKDYDDNQNYDNDDDDDDDEDDKGYHNKDNDGNPEEDQKNESQIYLQRIERSRQQKQSQQQQQQPHSSKKKKFQQQYQLDNNNNEDDSDEKDDDRIIRDQEIKYNLNYQQFYEQRKKLMKKKRLEQMQGSHQNQPQQEENINVDPQQQQNIDLVQIVSSNSSNRRRRSRKAGYKQKKHSLQMLSQYYKYKCQIIVYSSICLSIILFYSIFLFCFWDKNESENKSNSEGQSSEKDSNNDEQDYKYVIQGKSYKFCTKYMYMDQCVRSCPNNTFILNFTCVEQCPEFFYINSNSRCTQSCYQFISYNKYCVQSCTPEEHYHLDNICYMECPYPYFTYEDQCVEQCPSNYFIDQHRQCVQRCPKYHLKNHTCVEICPERYKLNQEYLTCEIDTNIIGNLLWLPDGSKADRCPTNYFESDKHCYQGCIDGYYRNYLKNTCEKCEANCLFCTNPNGFCIRCQSNYNLYSGKCVRNCSAICDQFSSSPRDRICKKGCALDNYRQYVFYSEILQKSMSLITIQSQQQQTIIYRPASPIIFIFHDYNESASDLLRHNLQCIIRNDNIILVLVQGDGNFYINSDQSNLYERYFIEEVIPTVAQKMLIDIRTANLALIGIGMGSYGVLSTALHYPDLFTIVTTFKGQYSLKIFNDTPEYQNIFGQDSQKESINEIGDLDFQMKQKQKQNQIKFILGYEQNEAAESEICDKIILNNSQKKVSCSPFNLLRKNEIIAKYKNEIKEGYYLDMIIQEIQKQSKQNV